MFYKGRYVLFFDIFMKTIEVVAAIIREEDRVLATQRGYGVVELLEHKSARWLRRDELNEVEWLPADVSVVNCL